MLVYGERSREVDTAELVASLIEREAKLENKTGLRYHLDLVRMMVDYGELMQGLADAADAMQGYSELGQSQFHMISHLPVIGRSFYQSCIGLGIVPPVKERLNNFLTPMGSFLLESTFIGRSKLPPRLTLKPLEGFAYYSVYPETYAKVANTMAREQRRRKAAVVGILSIGAILAAVVGGGLSAVNALQTWSYVRPHGHPFSRHLEMVGDRMRWFDQPIKQQRPFAIVDEGPGLSGSSFGAVADWLEGQGLAREHIVFFPSHDNPLGPQASEAHRERWAAARKYVASFESVFIETGRLAEWVADLTGGVGELEDIGDGRWRAKLLEHDDWPPVNIQQERRKYLYNVNGRQWLLKFIGLGHYGEDKLPIAHRLAAAGFIAPLVGLRHGFSVSKWLAEAQPLTNALLKQIDRRRLVDFVAAYLAHRARHFPAPAGAGATVAQLFAMMRYNTAQSIGEDYAAHLDRWQPQLDGLAAAERRVLTDNKMQPWEWLLLPNSRFQKADALDHHASHDLVGAQDIAWDLVGAIIELHLSDEEAQQLLTTFAAKAGYRPSSQQLAFYTYAYIAFQVGHYTLSATALAGEADEATRLREGAAAWAGLLGKRIDLPLQYELE